jgi:hypothetical protein
MQVLAMQAQMLQTM